LRRFGDAARVRVGENDSRGVLLQGLFDDFAGVNRRAVYEIDAIFLPMATQLSVRLLLSMKSMVHVGMDHAMS
jgi:hypothetical protein